VVSCVAGDIGGILGSLAWVTVGNAEGVGMFTLGSLGRLAM